MVFESQITIAVCNANKLQEKKFEEHYISLKKTTEGYKVSLVYHFPFEVYPNPQVLTISNEEVSYIDSLSYIKEKTFTLNGNGIVVKKYKLHDDIWAYGNVYINDSLGIIIDRQITKFEEVVTLFDTATLTELHTAILADHDFFELDIK